ncbi:MAG: DUF1080 domain-containing protein, partial [Verrucomicrobia bacterium]|nr:DUF1080 domain-containing protein [Cytophagales bacterium]
MKKCFFLLVSLIFSNAFAQEGDPKATEVWEPVPRVVTPTLNTQNPVPPPSDAVVLFNGKNLNAWQDKDGKAAQWLLSKDGSVTVVKSKGDIMTKQKFGDFQLHVEFRTPATVVSEGQGRGNSGIFLQERYEVQVLDCFNNKTYSNGQTASIYKQAIPLANACKKPGEWQVYDIIYMAPHFKEDGSLEKPAYVTVMHNGVLVQNHTELKGETAYIGIPKYTSHGKAAIKLQDHG